MILRTHEDDNLIPDKRFFDHCPHPGVNGKDPQPHLVAPPPPWFDGRLPYGAGGKRRVTYRVENVYRGRGEGRGFELCRGSVVAARRSSDYHATPHRGLG